MLVVAVREKIDYIVRDWTTHRTTKKIEATIALCEETERRKKTFQQKPARTNFEKIFQKAEEICKRLDMMTEEFVNERFIPKEAEKRGETLQRLQTKISEYRCGGRK